MEAKDLRNSILQWAIQGQLVSQDSADETALILLGKILDRKEELAGCRKSKKESKTEIYREGDSWFESDGKVEYEIEVPFDIPESWQWARLGSICSYIHRGKTPKYSDIRQYPVVAQKCNQWSGLDMSKCLFIDPVSISKYRPESILKNGDILINSTGGGTCGRVGLYNEELNEYELAVADGHITIVRPLISNEYLRYVLTGSFYQNIMSDLSKGSTNQIELTTSALRTILIPVPPTNEQYRIVHKIKELEPLIQEYYENKAQLAYIDSNFPSTLRKSIIQHATEGKLVPQDLADNCSSTLISSISERIMRKCGSNKNNRFSKSLIYRRNQGWYEQENGIEKDISSEIKFDIPDNWTWARLSQLGFLSRGKGIKRSDIQCAGKPCIRYGELYTTYVLKTDKVKSFISEELFDESKTISKGDLVMTLTGECKEDIGKTIAYLGDSDVACGGDLLLFNNCGMDPMFLSYVLNSPRVCQYKAEHSSGDYIVHLSAKSMESLLIPVPPLSEQQRIVAELERCGSLIYDIQNVWKNIDG